MAVIDTIATGVASEMGTRSRESLRRVRYTLASIGVAIPSLVAIIKAEGSAPKANS